VQVGNIASGGTGLTSDHPINFTYDSTLTAQVANLVLPTAIGSATYTTGVVSGGVTLPLFTYKGGMANTMQCSTCHEVHDPTNAPFLRMANTGSALCLACHGA
jgi:predicted CXXCH cytochrome family protein